MKVGLRVEGLGFRSLYGGGTRVLGIGFYGGIVYGCRIQGLCRDAMGLIERSMETTVWGSGFFERYPSQWKI